MLAIKEASADHITQTCCLGLTLCFDFSFLSLVVYYGYTRPRGYLKSVHLSQLWPSSLQVKEVDHKKLSLLLETKENKNKCVEIICITQQYLIPYIRVQKNSWETT